VVSARGYYLAPTAPLPPQEVAASPSGTTATVTWAAPPADGGAPVSSYTVTAAPDSATVTVGADVYQATLTGLSSASSDDFQVVATNAVGSSAVATQGTVSADTASQNLSVSLDDSTDTMTLIGGTATQSLSGVTQDLSLDTSNLTNDAAAAPPAACDLSTNGNVHPTTEPSFNDYKSTANFTIDWLDHLFLLKGAKTIGGVKNTEAIACTGGGGYWKNQDLASRSENVILTNSRNPNTVWNFSAPRESIDTQSVSKTLGFALGGQYKGASASVTGSEDVTITHTVNGVSWKTGPDAHFGKNFPKFIYKYSATRLNVFWYANSPDGYSSDQVGTTGLIQYVWPTHRPGKHKFYSVTGLWGCYDAQFTGWHCGDANFHYS
jgi:hypothetical protein